MGKNSSLLSRREFVTVTAQMAAMMGLSGAGAKQVMAAVQSDKRPTVIWLHFQECTGCSESLLRSSHPSIGKLILELISLDYHETLMAASGYQAEKSLHDTIKKGNYVLVVEGSIPTKDNGVYCKIAGKTALQILKETAPGANAIVSIGSCASWGGVQSRGSNPTGAVGVDSIIKNKPVVTIPGCPPIPEVFLSTLLYILTFNKLPKLDKKGRPELGYKYTIHNHCERRGHFNSGRFVMKYGDEGHQNGWCLFLMGCKGPVTHAACSAQGFNDGDVWPVSAGHPCVGCTEQDIAFHIPIVETAKVLVKDKPNVWDKDLKDTYPKVGESKNTGAGTLVGAGLAGAAIGTVAGFAGAIAAKLPKKGESEEGKKDE